MEVVDYVFIPIRILADKIKKWLKGDKIMLKEFFQGFLIGLIVFSWFIFGCCLGTYFAFETHVLLGLLAIVINASVFLGLISLTTHLIHKE
jgi:hypothetical protein